ncbi:MAG: Hsp20/alpha crystallin family protein [Chitinophagales bacterium]|nr:Hsp20/alpha crystallin family protein [Chitinophagales bacterium]MDW8427692.1 Hsp20/alpha crystallin family protein [Chitinophagales bacterium]
MLLKKFSESALSPFEAWVNDLFSNDFGFTLRPLFSARIPAVNVVEKDDYYRMDFAVPGFSKGDFNIKVDGNVLTVSGERKSENSKEEENFTMKEFSCTSFTRSFTLPDTVQTDKISAEYSDGVLKVTLPKTPEAKPKAIEIKVA